MSEIEIHCPYDELVALEDLKPNDKNPNQHGQDQIEDIAHSLKAHGIRKSIVVSIETGMIVTGHGTRLAAIRAGIKKFPVSYQHFENYDKEYAYVVADNSLQKRSHLNLSMINLELQNLGPNLDLKDLGIQNFELNYLDKKGVDPNQEWEGMPEFKQEDKDSFRNVIVHFDSEEDAAEFFKLIGQNDTGKTKTVWFPPQERMDTESKRYG